MSPATPRAECRMVTQALDTSRFLSISFARFVLDYPESETTASEHLLPAVLPICRSTNDFPGSNNMHE